jgi:hypothetical protein
MKESFFLAYNPKLYFILFLALLISELVLEKLTQLEIIFNKNKIHFNIYKKKKKKILKIFKKLNL